MRRFWRVVAWTGFKQTGATTAREIQGPTYLKSLGSPRSRGDSKGYQGKYGEIQDHWQVFIRYSDSWGCFQSALRNFATFAASRLRGEEEPLGFDAFASAKSKPGLRGRGNVLKDRSKAMPNYDYECQNCGERFEVFQSMNDAKLTDCPENTCDGAVKRLLGTGGGIIFKGSGFYQTDYRSDSYKEGAKAESKAGKSEAKPAKSEKPAAPAQTSKD